MARCTLQYLAKVHCLLNVAIQKLQSNALGTRPVLNIVNLLKKPNDTNVSGPNPSIETSDIAQLQVI
jgi:hypothetical protein